MVEIGPISAPRTTAAPAPTTARKLPLRLPFLHLIVQREPRPLPEAAPAAQAATVHAEPLDEDSARAPSDRRLVGYEDLVPKARLLPALRRALGATRAGPLDLASRKTWPPAAPPPEVLASLLPRRARYR